MRDYGRGTKDRHGGHLRNRNGGGKTPVQFRRFSSSTPARLAEGLGPKRLSLADWRCAPKTWVPRSRRFPRLGRSIDRLLGFFCQTPLGIRVVSLRDKALAEKLKALPPTIKRGNERRRTGVSANPGPKLRRHSSNGLAFTCPGGTVPTWVP